MADKEDKIDIEHLAELVKLSVSQAEKQPMTDKINDILQMISQVSSQNVEGVEPMAHPLDPQSVLREDKAQEISNEQRQSLLEIAPDQQEGFFVVPRVVE